MKRDHLIPQARTNKNGGTSIKYVKPDSGGSNTGAIPSPSLGFAKQKSHEPLPITEGSMLSKHGKGHEALLGDFKKNADGSVTIPAEDLRMVQKMLSEAVDEDQEAAYASEDGGNNKYFVAYLMGQGDINALRTIYAKQGAADQTIESVWHSLRYLRQFGVCDKETNYGSSAGFEGVNNLMTELGLNVSDATGSQYDYIEGMEGASDEKKELLKYAFDNPDEWLTISSAVVARETLDVEIISQIVESGTPALGDGFI